MKEYPKRNEKIVCWTEDICQCGHSDFQHVFPNFGRYLLNELLCKCKYHTCKCEKCMCPSYKLDVIQFTYNDGTREDVKQ